MKPTSTNAIPMAMPAIAVPDSPDDPAEEGGELSVLDPDPEPPTPFPGVPPPVPPVIFDVNVEEPDIESPPDGGLPSLPDDESTTDAAPSLELELNFVLLFVVLLVVALFVVLGSSGLSEGCHAIWIMGA